MEATEISINRWIDKQAVVYIYNRILFSHEKEHIWVSSMSWMNLVPIWQREIRKEENKYIDIYIYIYNLKKWYWWIYLLGKNRDLDLENRLADIRGEGKERVWRTEKVAWKHKHYQDSQWEFAVWLRELKPGLCDNLEQWDGVKGGREVQEEGDICITVYDSPETNTVL